MSITVRVCDSVTTQCGSNLQAACYLCQRVNMLSVCVMGEWGDVVWA